MYDTSLFPEGDNMGLPAKVTTGDGLLKELYAVSAEYQATVTRLRAAGTPEDDITAQFYLAAITEYQRNIAVAYTIPGISDAEMRALLINLATETLRWAKLMRQPGRGSPRNGTSTSIKGDPGHPSLHHTSVTSKRARGTP